MPIKNIFFKGLTEILPRGIYFFFFFYLARKLGASDFGVFSLAFSISSLSMILADPGLNAYTIREVAKNKNKALILINSIFTLKIFLGITLIFTTPLLLLILDFKFEIVYVVFLMSLLAFTTMFFDFFSAISDAFEKMELGLVTRISSKLLPSFFGIFAIYWNFSLPKILLLMNLGAFIALLYAYYLISTKLITLYFRIEYKYFYKLIKKTFYIGISILLMTLLLRSDIVLLSLFDKSIHQIGLYGATTKIIEILNITAFIITASTFPTLSRLHKTNSQEYKHMKQKVFQLVTFVALIISISVFNLSDFIIHISYGELFIHSAPILKILSLSLPFSFLNYHFANVLLIENKADRYALALFITFFIALILYVLLIPTFDIRAVSYIFIFYNSFLTLLLLYFNFLSKRKYL